MHLKQVNYPAEHHNQLHQRAFQEAPLWLCVSLHICSSPQVLSDSQESMAVS